MAVYNYRKIFKNFINAFAFLMLIFLLLPDQAYSDKRVTKTKRPEWVDSPPLGVFVGISYKFPNETDARADAINNAKRQIIESLGAIVESEFIDEIVESSRKVTTTDAFTQSRIKVVSRNIIAVKPEKVFIEKWRRRKGLRFETLYQAYVAVPFSKQRYKAFIKDLIDETYSLAKKRYNSAKSFAYQGKIFLAIDQLKDINKNIVSLNDIVGISPPDISDLKLLEEDINSLIQNIKKGIIIESEGDNQPGIFGSKLREPLTVFVYWQDKGNIVPIQGLETDFKILKGKVMLKAQNQTDSDGKALCEVKEISSAGRIEIEATVYFPEGYGIKNKTVNFHIFPENKVIVKVTETNLGLPVQNSYLENILLQKFSGEGFKIINDSIPENLRMEHIEDYNDEDIIKLIANTEANLVLLGYVSSGQVNKIQDGFYFARARGVLRVFNADKSSVVFNYIIDDKAAGNSEGNAGIKSIEKVSNELVNKLFVALGLN
jgi:hypothetical protein